MRISPRPIDISDEEGFAPERDLFSRRAFGESLTSIVTVSEDPLVILFDSPWGTGKTTFLKMWAGELRKLHFPVIYFDAFANDHIDNAFVAIAAEVISLSQSLKKTNAPAYKKFLKKAGRLGGILLRTSARLGVKAATLGAIDSADMESLKTVADDIAKEASSKADEYVEAILKLQSQEKASLDGLRNALTELAKTFATPEMRKNGENKPIIFIIDELDRCRPSFALELIERIKHIFSIPDVHFLLSAQLSQLTNSVRFNYGADIDAVTYLQKFYNVLVHFPDASRSRHERSIPKFVNYISSELSLAKDDMAIVRYVSEVRGLSFRTIERIATCLALARASVPGNHLWISSVIVVLCIMKIIAPDLLVKVRRGQIRLEEIEAFMAGSERPDDVEGVNLDWIYAWWRGCLAAEEPDDADQAWRACRRFLFQYSVDRERIIPLMVQHLDSFQPSQV
jgi:hypothetical protein